MSVLRVAVLATIILLSTTSTAGAQSAGAAVGNASVSGVVMDESKASIPGVTVTATRVGEAGSPAVEVTDSDGAFKLSKLRPGTYVLDAALDGFQPVSRRVTLVTGQAVNVAFTVVPAFSESVEVVASAERTGEVAILDSRRESAVVSDSISAEEISKTPDSSAASVVERLTGVTVLGDKYVFIRGLGERYSGTTINGATVPTTETDKRVVPLDLFPAKLLESVNVLKTYTPDKPGDFGSGVVEMTTTQFPPAGVFKLTLGVGQNSATGESFRRYGGGLDRFGSGGQKLSSIIPKTFLKRRSALDATGYTPQELETFGEAFIGDWTGRSSTAAPTSDIALTYGNTYGRVGVVLSAVSNHGYDNTDEELRFFGLDGKNLVPRNDYEIVTDREHANTGLVGNLSYRLSDTNRLSLNTIFTRDASAEDRYQEGLNTNSGGEIRDYRLRYQIEDVLSSRLRGEHNLAGPALGSLVEWNLTYSEASNESDLRENIYRESDAGQFKLQVGFSDSGRVDYFELQDEIQQGGVGYTTFFSGPGTSFSGSLKGGVDYLTRTRDFGARRFQFTTANQLQFELTGTPEQIFTAENIRPSGFELREVTGVNDAYDAEHTVGAAYLMADTSFGKWRVIGGARYEDSQQFVSTFNPFDLSSAVESRDDTRSVLPSLNLVYQSSPRTNFRMAYGRSVNRPEFRELSPFSFVEVTGGRSIAGNPDLTQATIDGLDFRWETFRAAGEVMAASVFYKNISDPIERIVQATTELRTSFVNAEAATLWGVELELRHSLEPLATAFRWWSVNFNYAYINSAVTVGDQQLSVITNRDRPLQGQSDQTTNLALQFLQPEWGSMVRFLGAYNGERLTDVGAFGLPDIYENAATTFDLVLSQELRFMNGVQLKLAGKNLTDEKRQYSQGSSTQRLYDPGRSVSLSLSYTHSR